LRIVSDAPVFSPVEQIVISGLTIAADGTILALHAVKDGQSLTEWLRSLKTQEECFASMKSEFIRLRQALAAMRR
jgi:hypothetical protein